MVVDELIRVTPDAPFDRPEAAWQLELERVIDGIRLISPGESPGWEMLAFNFSGARLYYLHAGSQRIERPRACPRRRFAPMAIIPLRGDFSITQLGHSCDLQPGQFAYLDAAAPMSLTYHNEFRHLYLQLPESSFVPSAFHRSVGQVARNDNGFDTTFRSLVENIWEQAETLIPQEHGSALSSLLSLCRLTTPFRDEAQRHLPCVRVRKAMAYIEHNLAESWLTPQVVADAQRVSRRYLDDLFGKLDLRIERWIWERRLIRAKEELQISARLHNGGKSIIQIALDSGFKSPSHFSRAFSVRFGAAPRDYRNACRQERLLVN